MAACIPFKVYFGIEDSPLDYTLVDTHILNADVAPTTTCALLQRAKLEISPGLGSRTKSRV